MKQNKVETHPYVCNVTCNLVNKLGKELTQVVCFYLIFVGMGFDRIFLFSDTEFFINCFLAA